MKKSPTDGFVDIHHHLIYGLDDGAQTWEQTQQMLTQARENGIRRIIATPHAEPGMRPFPMRADRAVQGIAERGESVDCGTLYARFCAHRALQMSALAGARSEVEA